ncbi:MAG: murein biosynthesis integral membrane protein MurJ [Candidatus Omnitrophica bacterium]|nr:murein biosynthesis integral membrane protein MurJ [Candidatus Omnitrophota bacterium]
MSTNKTIAKDASIIGLATLCSRLLGFIRDVVIARLFGVYLYAQAFVIAFRIPNLFRDLVGEGATNAAFVPVFSEYTVKHTKEEFWELTNVVLNLLLVILMGITLLGIVFSPVIVRLIAPGFIADPYKLETTIRLNRIIFPYILLISLSAYSMAILNSLRHFCLCAFAPCLLNIAIIIFAIIYGEGIKGLALGVLVGGALQLLVQIPLLHKKGFRFRFIWQPKHPAAKLMGRLMLPRLLSTSIYQLNNFVDSIFGSLASIVGEGGVAVLYFAYRLILFPIGIFTNALAQAILPTFSTQALSEDQYQLKRTLSFGLRATFFVMLPASVGFMILAKAIISTLFGGGRFDAYSIEMTAQVLFFYSIGLCAYGATKILQSCFFALKDTLTPAKVSFLALIINIILNIILMFPLKLGGLALATSLSGITTCLILFFILRKKLKTVLPLKEILFSFLRILFASLAMGLVVSLIARKQVFFQNVFWEKVTNLSIPILAGLVSYIVFCFIFRVEEMRQVWGWLRNVSSKQTKE